MPNYPVPPIPSMVSAPEIIDPMHLYQADQGYSIRRAMWSRPRRRWTLDYKGLTTDEMRQIKSFLMSVRLGALEFAWSHPTAIDKCLVDATTPVTLRYRHGLFTGQSLSVFNSPNPGINNRSWSVTVLNDITLTLDGSTAAGIAGTADTIVGVPHARAVMTQEDTFASPATLIGPDQLPYVDRRGGHFSCQVVVEELF